MTEAPDGWIEEVMRVRRPAGTHLSESTMSGGKSPLVRDDETNELATQVTLHDFRPAEEFDLSWAAPVGPEPPSETEPGLVEVVAVLLLLGSLAAAPRLAPHARRLWDERVLPAITARWSRLTTFRRAAQHQAPDELVAVVESAAARAMIELSALSTPIGESMTSAEARERWAAALVARAFSDEQFRRLSEARIEDSDGEAPGELDAAALSPEQVEAAVVRMLESDPSLLARLLGRSWQVGGDSEGRELPSSPGGGEA